MEFHDRIENRYYHILWRPLEWHGKEAVAVYGIDITTSKRNEKQLQAEKSSLEHTIGHIPSGICVFERKDSVITCLSVNPYYADMIGLSATELTGTTLPEFLSRVHGADWRRYASDISLWLDESDNSHGEYRLYNKRKQRYLWIHWEGRRAIMQDGREILYCSYTDVTERKEAEAALLTSRTRYSQAIQSASLAVWEYDIEGHRLLLPDDETARYALKRYGFTSTVVENIPEAMYPFAWHEEDKEVFQRLYEDIYEGKKFTSATVWFRLRPEDPPRCEHLFYTVLTDAAGKPVKAYGLGQDITAQKLEEERYNYTIQSLLAANPNAIAAFHLNLTKNTCFGGTCTMGKLKPLLQEKQADRFFEACMDTFAVGAEKAAIGNTINRRSLIEAFHQGRTRMSCNFHRVDDDGSLRWSTSYFTTIQHPRSGDIEAVVYTLDTENIFKENEIMQRLTATEFDYTAIIDVMKGTIAFHNMASSSEKTTPWQEALYDEDIRYAFPLILEPEEVETVLAAISLKTIKAKLDEADSYTYSFSMHDGSGQYYRKQLKYCYVNDMKQEILLIRTDITAAFLQQQEQMKQLQAALAAAKSANAAKTEFLSRVSHDIRTPMNVINAMTDFAFQDMKDVPKLEEDLQKIKVANGFLLSLINDLLDLSRIDSGQMELHPEPYSYEEFIHNIRDIFEPVCQNKGLQLILQAAVIPRWLMVDKVRLNQIVLNLVSNAVKYTKSGGIITIRAAGTVLQPDGLVKARISVADTGIGMSPEFQKKMFEPFTRDETGSSPLLRESGTGLGLAIVRKVVNLMQGTISVQSAMGKGTVITVSFTVPSVPAGEEPDQHVRFGKEQQPFYGKGTRILLAEDHPINAEISIRILESCGLTVVLANNGAEAVEQFQASKVGAFSLIFMDIQMPHMDGYEATKRIRSLPRPDAAVIPIIAMTANAYSEDIRKCLDAGMNDHVSKPVEPKNVFQVLERWMYPV